MGSFIYPNVPVTGEATSKEIINYLLDIDIRVPEEVKWFATIKVWSGNPDLYVKACEKTESSCLVTEDDIKAQTQMITNSSLLMISKETRLDDIVYVNYFAIPDSKYYETFQAPKFNDSTEPKYVCKGCRIAIAVVGNPSKSDVKSKYTLEIKGARTHYSLVLHGVMNFRIDPLHTLYFVIDIDEVSKVAAEKSTAFLNFQFIVVSGDADIYISRLHPYPDDKMYDKLVIIDNNNNQMYS